MNQIHITDELLQAFLLKETQDTSVAQHLSECALCRKRLEEYHDLIDHVQKMSPETFSFDVISLAMHAIIRHEEKKSTKQSAIFWGTLIVLTLTISACAIPFLPNIFTIFYSKAILTTVLVIGTGTAVLLFLLVDLLKHYKRKEERLFTTNLQPVR